MFAVLAIVLCCAVIPLGIGIAAFLGFSNKRKEAAKQEEEAIPQREQYR